MAALADVGAAGAGSATDAAGEVAAVAAAAPGWAVGAAGAVAGAVAASPLASVSTMLPWLSLSPTLTRMAVTTPACGEGTSIVALSDSSEISGSSAFTGAPTLTKISITGTSVKSPMSGTGISMV